MELHLTNHQSAASSLRHALRKHPAVLAVGDLPEFGPLNDGVARARFFDETLALSDVFGDDAFSIWRETAARIREIAPDRVLVWVSRSGSDTVFLSMVARFLADTGAELWRVRAGAPDGFQSVGSLSSDMLAEFVGTETLIEADELRQLATDFETYASRPEMVRLVDAGDAISFNNEDCFDQSILSQCSHEWARAAYVIGHTMGNCDPLNPIGDLYLVWRLEQLIDAGLVEANSDLEDDIRNYSVRLKR